MASPDFGDISADTNSVSGLDPERCRVGRTANQTLANEAGWTPTTITFPTGSATESYKSVSTMHSLSSNSERIIFPVGGLYEVSGMVTWNNSSTSGHRSVIVSHRDVSGAVTNEIVNYGVDAEANGSWTHITWVTQITVEVDDYVYMGAAQNSGGNLDVIGYWHTTWLAVRRIA